MSNPRVYDGEPENLVGDSIREIPDRALCAGDRGTAQREFLEKDCKHWVCLLPGLPIDRY